MLKIKVSDEALTLREIIEIISNLRKNDMKLNKYIDHTL